MLTLQGITYVHPARDVLFENLNLRVNTYDKVALIGNNGVGKSTLLQIIAGELPPSDGQVSARSQPYHVPQIFGQYNHLTLARALGVGDRLNALEEILDGKLTENNLAVLDEDWSIEERCAQALDHWQLTGVALTQKLGTLSGGQKTRVFLAGVSIHAPQLVLLDEPSNHLDAAGRKLLYDFIRTTARTLIVVSHDRRLLNLLDTVCELTPRGIALYGGGYEFYAQQKQLEMDALGQDVRNKEKALRKAKTRERETLERQQKLDARGKGKQEKAGVARIMMNTLRNKAENSSAKMKDVHAERIGHIARELRTLRREAPDPGEMKFGFGQPALHKGKTIFTAAGINFTYGRRPVWNKGLTLRIVSGERIALKGLNGSGKTTLLRMLLGQLEPTAGTVQRAECMAVYIDQDYSLLDKGLRVYEQAQQRNASALQEHEIKSRLSRFLFTRDHWDKPCGALSGGEKMRLMLCCLTVGSQSPDLIVLDEPTNSLDIQNVEILTAAINEYEGTLVVVSHDESFLEQIHTGRTIGL